jgi:hypothetical protein
MRIVDHRYLQEHNRYANKPCLLAILELDAGRELRAEQRAALEARLHAALPALERQRMLVNTLGEDEIPYLAGVVQQAAMELQRLASREQMVGFIGVLPRSEGRYRLVLPFSSAILAGAALSLATQLVDALLQGRAFALDAGLAQLRMLAERRAEPADPYEQPTVSRRRISRRHNIDRSVPHGRRRPLPGQPPAGPYLAMLSSSTRHLLAA